MVDKLELQLMNYEQNKRKMIEQKKDNEDPFENKELDGQKNPEQKKKRKRKKKKKKNGELTIDERRDVLIRLKLNRKTYHDIPRCKKKMYIYKKRHNEYTPQSEG